MFCFRCGQELPEGAKFCPSCGQSQTIDTQPAQAEAPKAEPVQAEAPKAEPQAEPVQAEAPKAEPQAEPVQAEAPKAEPQADVYKRQACNQIDLGPSEFTPLNLMRPVSFIKNIIYRDACQQFRHKLNWKIKFFLGFFWGCIGPPFGLAAACPPRVPTRKKGGPKGLPLLVRKGILGGFSNKSNGARPARQ